jgi:hypothetical protein
MEATYKLLSGAGGSCHFARVAVTTTEDAKYIDEQSQRPYYIYKDWLAAAQAGIAEALKSLETTQSVYIYRIEGTDVDTVGSTVFAAAAAATLQLFGQEPVVAYRERQWYALGKTYPNDPQPRQL